MNTAKKERAIRRRNLARAIDNTWTSLRSHLADTCKTRAANPEWHAQCCRDYSEILSALAVELHELARKDFKREFIALNEPL